MSHTLFTVLERRVTHRCGAASGQSTAAMQRSIDRHRSGGDSLAVSWK
jgi:hypothetical protein